MAPRFDSDGTYLYTENEDGYASLTLDCRGRDLPVAPLIGWGPGKRLGPMQDNVQVWLKWDGQNSDESLTWQIPVGVDSLALRDNGDRAAFASRLLQHSTLEVTALTSA